MNKHFIPFLSAILLMIMVFNVKGQNKIDKFCDQVADKELEKIRLTRLPKVSERDTISVFILATQINQTFAYHMNGYEIWTRQDIFKGYLDSNKKHLSDSIIVWQTKTR